MALAPRRSDAEYSWLVALNGNRLHAPADTEAGDAFAVGVWDGQPQHAPLACNGAFATKPPSTLARLAVRRCPRCCHASGLPKGIGSPSHDARCRRIMGLPERDAA